MRFAKGQMVQIRTDLIEHRSYGGKCWHGSLIDLAGMAVRDEV